MVMVTAGEIIPGDGEVIEGIASVDESAITGESAPVVRGERRRLLLRHRRHHRGIRLAEDPHHLRPRQQLSGPDDRTGGGRVPKKDPQRDRAEHPADLLTIIFLIVIVTLYPIGQYCGSGCLCPP